MLGMMRMECKGEAAGLGYTGSTTAFPRALTQGLTLCASVRRDRIINIYRFICSSNQLEKVHNQLLALLKRPPNICLVYLGLCFGTQEYVFNIWKKGSSGDNLSTHALTLSQHLITVYGELYFLHQQPSYQPPRASPEHPSGPQSIYQARPLSPSASFAFAEVHLHADGGDQHRDSRSAISHSKCIYPIIC